jgi:phosphatidylglycerophosphate synthase
VTVSGFLLFIAGCWVVFSAQSLSLAIVGFVVMHVGVVFDYADGIVARATKNTSFFGSWLDNCSDRAADFVVTLLAGIFATAKAGIPAPESTVAIGSAIFLMAFMHYMHDIGFFYRLASAATRAATPEATQGALAKIGAAWLMIFNRDTLVLLLSLSMLLPFAFETFAAVSGILVVNVLLLAVRELHKRGASEP